MLVMIFPELISWCVKFNSFRALCRCFNFNVFRADVLITQPIEVIWRDRKFESIDQIKWTNVGLRSGVFRTYPGHRSTRTYDPTK